MVYTKYTKIYNIPKKSKYTKIYPKMGRASCYYSHAFDYS